MSKKQVKQDMFVENMAIIVTLSVVLISCAACAITFFGNILAYKAGI